ncbi:hypothetical protein COO60DRAFT_809858 [Scenedesmus sp. NREL 46B-D3]|nr:hypothetical protein COO60DRAFT_809858 [Scenedesmus sp. NREL 46B-D3]
MLHDGNSATSLSPFHIVTSFSVLVTLLLLPYRLGCNPACRHPMGPSAGWVAVACYHGLAAVQGCCPSPQWQQQGSESWRHV